MRTTPDTVLAIDAVGELGVALGVPNCREGASGARGRVTQLYHVARVTTALADNDRRGAGAILNNGRLSERVVEERRQLERELDYWRQDMATAP